MAAGVKNQDTGAEDAWSLRGEVQSSGGCGAPENFGITNIYFMSKRHKTVIACVMGLKFILAEATRKFQSS